MLGVTPEMAFFFILFSNCQSSVSQTKNLMGFVNSSKVSRSCGHTPGKVAGQRATVKAEMNGVTPGLDRRPPPRWMGGQGGQSLKVLGRSLSDFEVFSFSKLNNQKDRKSVV